MTVSYYAPETLPRPPEWQDRAACRGVDPRIFYPDAETPEAIQDGRRFCISSRCPVVTECLFAALGREGGALPKYRYGVWGATGPQDRYQLYREGRKGKKDAA
ncbi:WhiB family transcriptional regulator [Streptomyces roseoverticillatus]|uniref:WhiB family transcriptional regulator n=1 Tax=Streptomyces roseoverticillatus TaxID=66429 RepID=UPI001F2776AC|nr:WhiB family transcriptional regulator [Streptomyces roseoverticillatus]MCF3101478.1 WhiB family transcriptional regulator [Streptomyces roseoverticillatus]